MCIPTPSRTIGNRTSILIFMSERHSLPQRKCACSSDTVGWIGQCTECREEWLASPRQYTNPSQPSSILRPAENYLAPLSRPDGAYPAQFYGPTTETGAQGKKDTRTSLATIHMSYLNTWTKRAALHPEKLPFSDDGRRSMTTTNRKRLCLKKASWRSIRVTLREANRVVRTLHDEKAWCA